MESKPEQPKLTESDKKKKSWAKAREIGSLLREEWPKYVVDVFVIILSITISFAFDNFKEDSSRKASEQIYLKALLADISSDVNELKEIIGSTEDVVSKANWLLTQTDKHGEINMDTFATAIKNVMQRPNFTSKDATFADLTSSGNMLLLEDINLKALLFEYHRLYESVRAVEIAERETVNAIVSPYLVKYFSIKGIVRNGSVVHQGVTIDQLLQSDDFSNMISIRLVNRKELLDNYKQELTMAEGIKATLASKITP